MVQSSEDLINSQTQSEDDLSSNEQELQEISLTDETAQNAAEKSQKSSKVKKAWNNFTSYAKDVKNTLRNS